MSRNTELNILKERIISDVSVLFRDDVTGHDLKHSLRVLNNALSIQSECGGDIYLITLAALLHDADDKKLFPDTAEDHLNAKRILQKNEVSQEDIKSIIRIIETVSFSSKKKTLSLEADIVQDADRLDALGAIGIARCFAYGAAHGRCIYSEDDADSEKRCSGNSGIAHFYQKLLLLENMMKTFPGKAEAHKRTVFMKEYLNHFSKETGCDVSVGMFGEET